MEVVYGLFHERFQRETIPLGNDQAGITCFTYKCNPLQRPASPTQYRNLSLSEFQWRVGKLQSTYRDGGISEHESETALKADEDML